MEYIIIGIAIMIILLILILREVKDVNEYLRKPLSHTLTKIDEQLSLNSIIKIEESLEKISKKIK
ncbi:hypothetical protein ACFL23_00775 [Patescibacteria group bacterium]